MEQNISLVSALWKTAGFFYSAFACLATGKFSKSQSKNSLEHKG